MKRARRQARYLDIATFVTIGVTFMLFALAAIEKGLSHDLLLEAGVLLVSIKLMLTAQRAELSSRSIEDKLDAIDEKLKKP